jgi:hypothetical protein
MPRDEELPIIRAFYDFVLWLNPKIAKFPRDQRFVLGEHMERQFYETGWAAGAGKEDNRSRAACGILELTHLGKFRKCNSLLQKMHTVSTRPWVDPPTDWREFPPLGDGKIRVSSGRGANSARTRAEVRQQA